MAHPAGFEFRSLNRRFSRLERARCSFRANKLESLPLRGQPTGLTLLSFAPTIVGAIEPNLLYHQTKTGHKGLFLFGGISRTRTYDPHDVNVVL